MTNSANDKLKEIILEPDLHSAGLCRFITTLLSDSFFTPGLMRVLNLIVSIPFRIHGFSNLQKITCIILRNLFGLYLFSHQSCATGTLLLRKQIYPRKSSPNLRQVIFFTLLNVFDSALIIKLDELQNDVK